MCSLPPKGATSKYLHTGVKALTYGLVGAGRGTVIHSIAGILCFLAALLTRAVTDFGSDGQLPICTLRLRCPLSSIQYKAGP